MLYITTEAKETQIKYCFQRAWIGLYNCTTGGGHCQTQVPTKTGRRSSDIGCLGNQTMKTVKNSVLTDLSGDPLRGARPLSREPVD